MKCFLPLALVTHLDVFDLEGRREGGRGEGGRKEREGGRGEGGRKER